MGVRTFYRILWTCFKRERLAAFIDGKTVAIDVSVLLHAILGDEVVSQVLQGTESIFAEVFAFLNEWFINKGMGAAKALVFVFDGDLSRPYHCDTCKAQATDRLAAKDAVAGSERAETRKLAAAQFDEILLAANKAVHDGVLVDEKLLALKRAELDALAKKSLSRSTCVRTAMLFWIVQHNNHLFRDADGLGGVAAGKDDKKARVQRPTKEEKRRGNTYDVKRKHYKRCPITIFLSRGEADDSLGALSQQNIVDIVATTDADAIAWACSVMILKGVFDRRKQETHLVSVVTEQAVLEHIRNVLINVDDPRQSWRLQDKFDEWRQQQQDLVGPKGKSKKKATTTAAAAAEVAAAAAAAAAEVAAAAVAAAAPAAAAPGYGTARAGGVRNKTKPARARAGAAVAAAATGLCTAAAATDSGTAGAGGVPNKNKPARARAGAAVVAAATGLGTAATVGAPATAVATASGTVGAAARKKKAAARPRGGAATVAAATAPVRLVLPFALDRAKMATLLSTPAAVRKALLVLASFLGTDFIYGALNTFSAVTYTAWWVLADGPSARREVVRAAFEAGTMNRKALSAMTADAYADAFDKAVAHFDKPFDVSMSVEDWGRFLVLGTTPPPASQPVPGGAAAPAAHPGGSNNVRVTFTCGAVESDPATAGTAATASSRE